MPTSFFLMGCKGTHFAANYKTTALFLNIYYP